MIRCNMNLDNFYHDKKIFFNLNQLAMKTTTIFNISLFMLAFLGFATLESHNSVNAYELSKKDKLKTFSITLGGQTNATDPGLLSLEDRRSYSVIEAAGKQDKIDVIFAYGKKTKYNLITPGSNRLKSFGRTINNNIIDVWSTFNKGTLINLKQENGAGQLFKKIKTKSELKSAYSSWKKDIKEVENYELLDFGPSLSIRNVEVGDILIFRSRVKKDLYAIMRVTGQKSGNKGSMTLDVKVTEVEE